MRRSRLPCRFAGPPAGREAFGHENRADIVGVVFIGLPVSSLSGDNIAPEVARPKGEQEAIRKVMVQKNCGGT